MSLTAALRSDLGHPWAFDSAPRGVSDACGALARLLGEVEEHFSASVTGGETRRELARVFAESAAPDWDGYGGNPITFEAFLRTWLFILALPPSIASPAIVPEPSGEIGLEWSTSEGRTFVVSIGKQPQVTFAGLLGGGTKIHGVANFVGLIPQEIAGILLQRFSRRSTEAWAA